MSLDDRSTFKIFGTPKNREKCIAESRNSSRLTLEVPRKANRSQCPQARKVRETLAAELFSKTRRVFSPRAKLQQQKQQQRQQQRGEKFPVRYRKQERYVIPVSFTLGLVD